MPGVESRYVCLPVVRGEAVRLALEGVRSFRPDAVLALGQANGRARVSVERIGINVDDYRIPDNVGTQPHGEPVVPDGPAAYLATLPVRAMVDAMLDAGVPAAISNSAGTFLCNHLLYGLLHAAAVEGLTARIGFIHLPYLPGTAARKSVEAPSMAVETALTGLRAAISVLPADHSRDRRTAASTNVHGSV
jgi:pyroglutamyl-peptidase